MSGKTTRANGTTGKGGNNNAPVTTNTKTSTEVSAQGAEGAGAGKDTEGEGDKDAAAAAAAAGGNAPAAAAAGAPAADGAAKKLTKKAPPLKNGKRAGGGRTAGAGKPTYNVGICSYNELVIDSKTKEFKFLPHILNGNWVPTYNGDPAGEVDETLPKFADIDAALAAGAIEFGMKVGDKEMVKLYGYAQNIQLAKGGFPLTGKVHASGDDAGKPISYSCFITATAENAAQVVANMEAYLNSPYKSGVMFELLPEEDRKLTYPQVAAATLAEATAATATK